MGLALGPSGKQAMLSAPLKVDLVFLTMCYDFLCLYSFACVVGTWDGVVLPLVSLTVSACRDGRSFFSSSADTRYKEKRVRSSRPPVHDRSTRPVFHLISNIFVDSSHYNAKTSGLCITALEHLKRAMSLRPRTDTRRAMDIYGWGTYGVIISCVVITREVRHIKVPPQRL